MATSFIRQLSSCSLQLARSCDNRDGDLCWLRAVCKQEMKLDAIRSQHRRVRTHNLDADRRQRFGVRPRHWQHCLPATRRAAPPAAGARSLQTAAPGRNLLQSPGLTECRSASPIHPAAVRYVARTGAPIGYGGYFQPLSAEQGSAAVTGLKAPPMRVLATGMIQVGNEVGSGR